MRVEVYKVGTLDPLHFKGNGKEPVLVFTRALMHFGYFNL
jgi:hypothetical protein